MEGYLRILLFGLFLCSCNHSEIKFKTIIDLDSLNREESKATIINDSVEAKYIIGNNYIFWNPTKYQMKFVDSIIVNAITENPEKYFKYLKADSFKDFYKQYVCYVDSKGDSIVYMNAICEIPNFPIFDSTLGYATLKRLDWQHHLDKVEDGGDCYWRIFINFTKRKYFSFSVNGK